MPTYGYRCEKCGHEFDLFQSIKDDPVKKCPECKGRVKRLIGSGAGIIFKGGGFYQTDYKRSCPKNEGGSGEGSKPSDCSACPHNSGK